MEHPCEKCGAAVGDGVAFCPNCGAPQIRVTGTANHPATPPLSPGTPGEIQPSAEPVALRTYPGESTPESARLHWSEALPGAALAGFLLALALAVPYASPFLLMLAAGGLAAGLYAKRSQAAITPRLGARVGLLGGLLGWVIIAIVLALEISLGGGRLIAALRQALQQQIATSPDPRAQEILGKLTSPGGMAAVVAFGMVLFLAIVLICGAVGGAVSATLFAKKDKHRLRM